MKQRSSLGFALGGLTAFLLIMGGFIVLFEANPPLLFAAQTPLPPVVQESQPQEIFIEQHEQVIADEDPYFPQSEYILRDGANFLAAPEPKFLEGQYLDVNLKGRLITLFQDGHPQGLYKIIAIGPPSMPTPTGTFNVLGKERNHFASKEKVWMPWSIHVYEGAFIHGIPYYPDGSILKSYYSHGCIRVATVQQQELYAKVNVGNPIVIY